MDHARKQQDKSIWRKSSNDCKPNDESFELNRLQLFKKTQDVCQNSINHQVVAYFWDWFQNEMSNLRHDFVVAAKWTFVWWPWFKLQVKQALFVVLPKVDEKKLLTITKRITLREHPPSICVKCFVNYEEYPWFWCRTCKKNQKLRSSYFMSAGF